MGIHVDIRADVKHAQRFFRELDQTAVNKAAANAQNVIIRKVRTESVKEVSKVRKLKRRVIRDAIRITERAKNWDLRAVVQAFGRVISLKEYGAKQTAIGVQVNIDGKRETIVGAFGPGFAGRGRGKSRVPPQKPRKGGHVFKRKGQARVPVEKLWGPSIPTGFIRDVVRAAQRRIIDVHWRPTLNSKLEDQLAKLRAKHGGR